MRINQFLASAGLGSRRSCETLILEGRVMVNGKRLTELGFQVDAKKDFVKVDGKAVNPEQLLYLVLNKPRGYVCTKSDERGRRTIYELLPQDYGHLFSVGRLDRDSEGLLIMTNDGEFANRMTHPRYKIPKMYDVITESEPKPNEIGKFIKGVFIKIEEDRPMKRATAIKVFKRGTRHYEITLAQGYKRQLRQMFIAIGHPVEGLCRIQIGNLRLGNLRSGSFRNLKPFEVKALLDFKPPKTVPIAPRTFKSPFPPNKKTKSKTP